MKTIELTVERRSTKGKGASRQTRFAGKIPAVVYGAGKPNVDIIVDRKALSDAFRGGAGENAIFLLKLTGSDQSRHAMIKEFQRDPVTRHPVHIDFVRVMMDTKIRIAVSIEIQGVARGVKTDGGILDFVTREVEVECLPGNIPEHLPIDVSELGIGDALRIADLPVPEGVTILEETDRVLVHVVHPIREEEVAPAAEAAVAGEPAEPEVLKKGKAVEEGAEEKEKEK